MNYCDKCGGPLRDPRLDRSWHNVDGCRLCWLETYVIRQHPSWTWRGLNEQGNSTANTPATSMWLPPGARAPFFDSVTPEQERRTDETLFRAWLAYYGLVGGWVHVGSMSSGALKTAWGRSELT